MDKYEYNLKLEEIDKLVDQGDYEEAASLADTIDWRRVRNVRTLCLISEIYEASERLEDSKAMLLRAYRRSPVGRTVLYRLVEVTTALGQYDEAIEYYSEYVQAAPHDNNRYILKYKIYKGRGSKTEELISILEEYLGQEYTERWAYELAVLYQQSGQMQKCLAACDDLVLWFHSGKYVLKALELKKRYAALTPKQQQIYEDEQQQKLEERFEEPAAPAEPEPPVENVIPNVEQADGEVIAESIMAQTEKEIADQVTARKAEIEEANQVPSAGPDAEKTRVIGPVSDPDAEKTRVIGSASGPDAEQTKAAAPASEPEEPADLQVELAKSMRKIISGVVKRVEDSDEDIPASVDTNLQNIQKLQMPESPEQTAGQLSIDDVLLSMSDKGKSVTDAVLQDEEEEAAAEKESAADEAPEGAEDNRYAADSEDADAQTGQEDGGRRRPDRAAARKSVREAAQDELTDVQREALQYTSNPDRLLRNKRSLPTYMEEKDDDLGKTRRIASRDELTEAARKEILAEKTIRIPTEQITRRMSELETGDVPEEGFEEEILTDGTEEFDEIPEMTEQDGGYEDDASYEDDDEYEESLMIPEHLRNLFAGFTEVEGLEDQIANAIIQAQSKGDDKTSRSGNILIFGPHGSGKTTLAMSIAKAVAQDRENQVLKVAKIYASDLNRKDIAATVARIAGGTLIIEEAGDLEPGTVEQLTTAMEFRTDGLIMILEDEQSYIHELLMRHPRFTMKFTAQIYLPEYTIDELANFGQIYANSQDFVIGDEAWETFCQKMEDAFAQGETFTVSHAVEMVEKAIARSNKFFRKLAMGKKRYDENDYVILFPKDFK